MKTKRYYKKGEYSTITTEEINLLHKAEKAACKIWGIQNLYKRTRERKFTEPRQTVFYYMKAVNNTGPKPLERKTGFDHSTVRHAEKTIQNLRETNFEFRIKYNWFLKELNKLPEPTATNEKEQTAA